MTKPVTDGETCYTLYDIPRDIWHNFKMLVMSEKTTIKQRLLELVEEESKKYGKI